MGVYSVDSLGMNRFARLMLRCRTTAAQLVERTGYDRRTVWAWRSGTRTPGRGAVALIATALGVPAAKVQAAFSKRTKR